VSVTLILICWTLPYVSICLHLFIDIYSKYVFDYDAWSLAVCCSWTLLTFWFFLGSFNDNIRTVLLCYKKMPSSGKNLKLIDGVYQLLKVKTFFWPCNLSEAWICFINTFLYLCVHARGLHKFFACLHVCDVLQTTVRILHSA
jgi:hypothetical protein